MAYKRRERKGFLVLHRNRVQLEFLTDAQRGQLLMALLDFSETGEKPQFDGVLGMAFATMAEQIAFDADAWKEKCEQNRQNRERSQNADEPSLTVVDHRQPSSTAVNVGDQSKQNKSESKSKPESESEPIPPTPQGDGCGQEDEGFTRFWDAYPRKQKKQAARKAFGQALGKVSLADMLQALEQQRSSPQWNRDDGRPMGAPTAGTGAGSSRRVRPPDVPRLAPASRTALPRCVQWPHPTGGRVRCFGCRLPLSLRGAQRRGNPYSRSPAVIARSAATWQSVLLGAAPVDGNTQESERFGERIATPVCGLVRNDTVGAGAEERGGIPVGATLAVARLRTNSTTRFPAGDRKGRPYEF